MNILKSLIDVTQYFSIEQKRYPAKGTFVLVNSQEFSVELFKHADIHTYMHIISFYMCCFLNNVLETIHPYIFNIKLIQGSLNSNVILHLLQNTKG